MSFESKNPEQLPPAEDAAGSDSIESIDAQLEAIGDPDDPWAEPDAVAQREELLAKRAEMVRAGEANKRAARAAQAVIEKAAGEQALTDSLRANELAQEIKAGTPEKPEEIPSDDEIIEQFGETIAYDAQGRAFFYHENVRFSEKAMLAMLGKNLENVAVIPKGMLKKPAFKMLLEQQYRECYPRGNFETFYKLVSDPRYGFGESEPKWKKVTAEQIERSRALAREESARLQESGYGGVDSGANFSRMLEEGIRDMEAEREIL